MLIQEAWFLQRLRPPRWTCMWDRTRWKPHSPTLWERTALQSLGQGGKDGGSQGPRLRIGSGMWDWSWGLHLLPTQEQEIMTITLLMLCQVEFFIVARWTSWSDRQSVSSCGCADLCVCVCLCYRHDFSLISAADALTFSCRIVVCLGLFSARLAL